jgi:hypothetical protein
MRKISVVLVPCVIAFNLLGCGGNDSNSGTAELSLNGMRHAFSGVELRIDVNPTIGRDQEKKTIESGKPQPIRYLLRTESWPQVENGKGFNFSWWIDGDSPMESLKGLVGQRLTNDPSDAESIGFNFEIDGKSLRNHDEHENWLIIKNAGEETVSGTFGGEFEFEKELTFENLGSKPEIVKIEKGYFKAPVRKFYKKE